MPPPHANAEMHKLIMARVEAMSREEFVQSLVDVGICYPDGQLTEHYRPAPRKRAGGRAG